MIWAINIMVIEMYKTSSRLRFVVGVIFFIISFFSFSTNIFQAADENWFRENQLTSEQLVVEGLMRKYETGEYGLGRYRRKDIGTDPSYLYELYRSSNTNGDFIKYISHYGFQTRIMYLLGEAGCKTIDCFHGFNSVLLASIFTIFLILFASEFGLVPSLISLLFVILSPWFLVFAKNLYFAPYTWFLPILVSLPISKYYGRNVSRFLFWIAILYLSFLLNALYRYEYITSVAMATCAPIAYVLKKRGFSEIKILRLLTITFFVFLLSFFTAVTIHASSLSNDISDGYRQIYHEASKRIEIKKLEDVVADYCSVEDYGCASEISRSFKTSHIAVIANYFVFPSFIPWSGKDLYIGLPCSAPPGCLLKLRYEQTNNGFIAVLSFLAKNYLSLQGQHWVVERIVFALFFIASLFAIIKSDRAMKYAYFFALASPLSWFILAKPHSDAHYSMNYIVWFIAFIPFSLIAIASQLSTYIKSKFESKKIIIK